MLQPGEVIDRYTVEGVLGEGGMAVVYRVRHNQLGSLHALKVLTLSGRSIRERLLQEGRLQASLRHPNVVSVTDVIDVDGAPGLVMEFVDGPPLDVWLQQQRPSLEEVERIFRAIAGAVGHAHAQGLVHRDLKPANVMLAMTPSGLMPKVADFGLAKLVEGDGSAGKTRSGVTMGTPAYMAPEQIRDSKNVDHRADMFSLGCILYEMVTGRPPFSGPDVLSIFNAVASASYAPPVSLVPDLPPNLQEAIHGLLVVDRDVRLQHVPALMKSLGDQGSGLSFPPPPSLPPQRDKGLADSHPTWSGSFVAEDPGPAPTLSQRSEGGSSVAPPARGRARLLLLLPAAGLIAGGVAAVALLGAGGVWFFGVPQQWAVERALASSLGEGLSYGTLAVDRHGATLTAVRLLDAQGQERLIADQLRFEASLSGEVPDAHFTGLTLYPAGLGGALPLPHLDAQRVRIALSPDAEGLVVEAESLEASRSGGASFTLRQPRLTVEGAAWTASSLSVAPDRLTLAGLSGPLTLGGDGRLALPAALASWMPAALGGSDEAPGGLRRDAIALTDAHLLVRDGALSADHPPVDFQIRTLTWRAAGPDLSMQGALLGAPLRLEVSGSGGSWSGEGTWTAIPLAVVAPWLDPALEHRGVRVAGGSLDATFALTGQGDQLGLRETLRMDQPALVATGDLSRRDLRLLRARDLAQGEVEISGSLGQLRPLVALRQAAVGALLEPAGKGKAVAESPASSPVPPPASGSGPAKGASAGGSWQLAPADGTSPRPRGDWKTTLGVPQDADEWKKAVGMPGTRKPGEQGD
ncbi:MAG: serine/threonine protein kinase [Deltaproteobacteria bacterium]|nr:serine/threonine protein kinase [Deltaproteobacteria bacterium]